MICFDAWNQITVKSIVVASPVYTAATQITLRGGQEKMCLSFQQSVGNKHLCHNFLKKMIWNMPSAFPNSFLILGPLNQKF